MLAAATDARVSDEIVNTVIVTLGGVVIAFFGYLGIRAQVKRVRGKVAAGQMAGEDEVDASLVAYENDPGKFVKDLLAAAAAAEQERLTMREERQKDREEIDRMWKELRELRDQLDETRRSEIRFRDALSRWIHTVFENWGKTPTIPLPDGEDLVLLKPIFPFGRRATDKEY